MQKFYIVLQFYMYLLSILLLILIFQVLTNTIPYMFSVLPCSIHAPVALPNDNIYKCFIHLLYIFFLMMAQKALKHAGDYTSTQW
jgi:hypothetical protein